MYERTTVASRGVAWVRYPVSCASGRGTALNRGALDYQNPWILAQRGSQSVSRGSYPYPWYGGSGLTLCPGIVDYVHLLLYRYSSRWVLCIPCTYSTMYTICIPIYYVYDLLCTPSSHDHDHEGLSTPRQQSLLSIQAMGRGKPPSQRMDLETNDLMNVSNDTRLFRHSYLGSRFSVVAKFREIP